MRHLVFLLAFLVLIGLPIGLLVRPLEVAIIVPSHPAPTHALPAAVLTESAVSGPDNIATQLEIVGSAAEGQPFFVTVAYAIWLVGAVAFITPVVFGLWQLRRIRRFGFAWTAGRGLVAAVARSQDVRRRIEVLQDESVTAPMTFGILQPVIVFPFDVSEWGRDDVRRAITHELAHVKRADWFVHCVARVTCAVYWFHPLVWFACRRLVLEAERAADDVVVKETDAARYADQLVSLASRVAATESARPALAMANRGELSARIASVLDTSRRRDAVRGAPLLAGLLAAFALTAVVGPLRVVMTAQTGSASGALNDVTAVLPSSAVARQDQGRPTAISSPRKRTFEVASVKRSAPPDGGLRVSISGTILPGGRWRSRNATLDDIIRSANRGHGLRDQLIGGPNWVRTIEFDIEASSAASPTAGAGDTPATPTRSEIEEMVRTLLADRFKLRLRAETRSLQGYELALAREDGRLGSGVKPAAFDCAHIRDARQRGESIPSASTTGCAVMVTDRGPVRELVAGGLALGGLANVLAPFVGAPIVDKTGRSELYDLRLEFAGDLAVAPAQDTPSVFTALQDQLGLRLQRTTVPTEVLVIESVELPSPD